VGWLVDLVMADRVSEEQRSWNMSRIRGKNTKPELIVRNFLYNHGFRYRIHNKSIPGCPDISNQKYKIAIFVNGCYWHRHGCEKTTTPKSNTEFWENKFSKNIERDRNNHKLLIDSGWNIEIIWECQVSDSDLLEKLAESLKYNY